MSVLYDADPGRLEVYRPRPDGLMGRSFGGSVVIHLLLGVILCTVRFPAPKPPAKRHYRITEVTLLPPSQAPAPAVEADEPQPEPPGPRDLSLFLNDIAPRSGRRHHRSRRHSHRSLTRTAAPQTPMLAREVKPDAPDRGAARSSRVGPQIAQGLPNMLMRPMSDRQALDPTSAGLPDAKPGGAPPAQPAPPAKPAERVATLRARPAKERHAAHPARLHAPPRSVPSIAADGAPKPVMVARAEPRPSLADLTPAHHDEAGLSGPSPVAAIPVDKPTIEPAEHPVEMPAGRGGPGKRTAQLPGDLFGSGSGMGPSPSHRDVSVPEGRPGVASVPGPRHPRMSRSHADHATAAGGDSSGISAVPAPSGVHLPEEEHPGMHRGGEPTGLGSMGGKGTPIASLPSTDSEARGNGSGASSAGGGTGGGYGSEGPRAVGGGSRPGRATVHTKTPSSLDGDGSGGKTASTDGGIGIPSGGLGGGGAASESGSGGHSTGSEAGGGGKPGKRIARADLPGDEPDGGTPGGAGSGPHKSAGADTGSGPRSFNAGGKRRIKTGTGEGDGDGDGRGKGKDGGSGDGDGKGVALPGGDGGGDDGPGHDGGDSESGSSFKGRHEPTGVYVDTTGKFTLPGAIYDGDYRYNSQALRRIMDELNSRTKVKVQLGGQYQSIAPGSFRNAPVVVFTGHKAFELTDEQRKVLKEYVDKGGMIWADLSHAAFDDSFRGEMEKIFGRAPTRLSSGHPIYKSFYVLHGPPPSDLGSADPFEGISVGDRLGVIITPNRYFSTVTRGLNASEEAQEAATQAVVNIYMYAAANYKAVKDAGE